MLLARQPQIRVSEGPLAWSKVPEFSMAYNGYSVVIPYVEHYLNAVMGEAREQLRTSNPGLANSLTEFIRQETLHARYHKRFNQRMFDEGYAGLNALIREVVEDLERLRKSRSLAFNLAYCAGFESIATYASVYIWTQCDRYFEDAEPSGANLLLWHVAEEFEHRAVCHDAFMAVSGHYLTRIHGLIYAFRHIGTLFMRAEQIIMDHHSRKLSKEQRTASRKQSRRLFWRQLLFVAPRMLKIFYPRYSPGAIKTPTRITRGLDYFKSDQPLSRLALFP